MRSFTFLSKGLRGLQGVSIPRSSSRSLSSNLIRHRPSHPTLPSIHSRLSTSTYLLTSTRHNSSSNPPNKTNNDTAPPLTTSTSTPETTAQNAAANRLRREQEPAYQITFTCKPCGHRSSHRISKHGYHRGTVLIKCPSCENRHVISDHLKIFFDEKSTLEDILKKQGGKVVRGYVDGDMEFWEDGSVKAAGGEGEKD
ncbi:DNL-type zinc finger protein, partial [Aspergillus ibericus CBS 121593]